jgi:hypothetical protein
MYSILPDGKLAITASESSSKHDFDFLAGGWKIRNRKLKEPLTGREELDEFDATQICRQVLQGFGDFDIFSTEFDGKPFEGFTLRLAGEKLLPRPVIVARLIGVAAIATAALIWTETNVQFFAK